MSDCHQIDPLVTPFVDEEITPADRHLVDRHLQECRACRGRVSAERAVQGLLRARRSVLAGAESSPAALRTRLASLGRPVPAPPAARSWRDRVMPLALAATLVLVVAGAFVYEATARSTQLLAAELTADHLKCFRVINNVMGTHQEAQAVERAMASRFDWQMHLPEHAEEIGLELVGARPCLYGEGVVAHIMYRHHGHPVSIFMLPKSARAEQLVEVLGHQAAVWSVGNRTFVLVAREPRAEVERMTSFVHSALR
ncbi:MAG: zf-HC2 domain-containing protein [Acidobacteriota bacterium]